jgi:hypothetical protein
VTSLVAESDEFAPDPLMLSGPIAVEETHSPSGCSPEPLTDPGSVRPRADASRNSSGVR